MQIPFFVVLFQIYLLIAYKLVSALPASSVIDQCLIHVFRLEKVSFTRQRVGFPFTVKT